MINVIILIEVIIISVLMASESLAQRGRLDYCASPALRETIIYLDITTPGFPDGRWISSLQELRFAAREPVRIIWFNPVSGEGKEIFHNCYPGLTADEERKMMLEPGYQLRAMTLGGSANQVNRDQRDFIYTYIQLMGKLAQTANRAVSANGAATRSVIDFLWRDRSRYAGTLGVARIIIFSNMEEAGATVGVDLIRNPVAAALHARERRPNDFGFSQVYVYGVQGHGSSVSPELMMFWKSYFQVNNADLASFDRNLVMPAASPGPEANKETIELSAWDGAISHMSSDGQNRYARARLQMLVEGERNIESAWLDLPGVGATPVRGKLICRSRADCSFNGHIDGAISEYLKAGDEIYMQISGDVMSGKIKLFGVDLIQVGEFSGVIPPEYGVAFSRIQGKLK